MTSARKQSLREKLAQHDARDYSLVCRLCEWTGSTATAVRFTGRERYGNTDYQKETTTDHAFIHLSPALRKNALVKARPALPLDPGATTMQTPYRQ
jgi:hypothetical protein